MYEIEISNQEENIALIPINQLVDNDDISIEIYNYYNQLAAIDIVYADKKDVTINKLEIFSNNMLNIKFLAKKYSIKIKELIFHCSGINYSGGSQVENLIILSDHEKIILGPKIAINIEIKLIDKRDDSEKIIRELMPGFNVIPGSGDYALNSNTALNSLKKMQSLFPNSKWIAPVAAWFADSLDISKCHIMPGFDKFSSAKDWQVANKDNKSAYKILTLEDSNGVRSNYGSSIDDKSLKEYLVGAKKMGFNIIFYPLIMVDKLDKPWRGHINGSAQDIDNFYNNQYKPFIEHYAQLVSGLVDAFIIGSELVNLNKIFKKDLETNEVTFPFVKKLIDLAGDVRKILGKNVQITYAADWSEYHTVDGCFRPLDELWAYKEIDFVGIDAYFPLTDSKKSNVSVDEIKKGWISGEGYNYYYDSDGHKIDYKNKHWNEWKNLSYWWYNEHWEWNDEKKESIKTKWEPKMKPIWFTEFGFPSIDKASNKPNVFYDPQCIDGGVPKYSNGKIDFSIQIRALRATLEYWQNSEFIQNMLCWCWDARGEDWFKNDYYADGDLWHYGHWVDSKIGPVNGLFIEGEIDTKKLKIESKNLTIKSNNIIANNYSEITVSGDFRWINNGSKTSHIIKTSNGIWRIEGDCIFTPIKHKLNSFLSKSLLLNTNLSPLTSDNSHEVLIPARLEVGKFKLWAKDVSFSGQVIADRLIINANNLYVSQGNFKIQNSFNLIIKTDLVIYSHLVQEQESGWRGEKSFYNHTTENIISSNIQAKNLLWQIGNNCSLEAVQFTLGEFRIQAKNLYFLAAIAKDTIIEEFYGTENFFGNSNYEKKEKITLKAFVVSIRGQVGDIIVDEMFLAEGSKVFALNLYTEATNYEFNGIKLEGSLSEYKREKQFIGSKSSNNYTSNSVVEGVEFVIDNQAYIIAEGKIWLRGSSINADKLKLISKKEVVLEGLVGNSYHSITVNKTGFKLSLTCGSGELSFGSEMYKKQSKQVSYQEYLYPSSLIGYNFLDIKTDKLMLAGGFLVGRMGSIEAEEWISTPVALESYNNGYSWQVSAGMKMGIKENVSGAVKSLANTSQMLQQTNTENPFIALNLLSSGYSDFQNITNLLAGNVISVGFWLEANASYNCFESNAIDYGINYAVFDKLTANIGGKITGALEISAKEQDITTQEMLLEIPESERSSFGYGASISVNSQGSFSVSGYFQRDNMLCGLGYGGHLGGGGRNAFGDNISILYKNKNSVLDVNYSNFDKEMVHKIWNSDFSTNIKENIADQGKKLIYSVNNPVEAGLNDFSEQWHNIKKSGVSSGDELTNEHEDQENGMIIFEEEKVEGGEYNKFSSEEGIPIGYIVKPEEDKWESFTPKSLKDIGNNLYSDFVDLENISNKYHVIHNLNLPIMALSTVGEFSEYVGDNIVYGITKIPGSKYVLEAIGSTIGKGFEFAYSTANKGAKLVLTEEQLISVSKFHEELPHGVKILGEDAANGALFFGAGKVVAPLTKTMSGAIKDTLIISKFWETNKIPSFQQEIFEHLPKDSILKSAEDLVILKPFYKKGAKFFDHNINIISESIAKKLTKEEIFKIVPKEFEPIIKFSKNNVAEGIHHMENHHILLKETPQFKELFKMADMDIKKDISNLLYLPDTAGKSFYPTNKSLHSGMHNKDYYEKALEKTIEIMKEGKDLNWNASQYKKELLEIIKPMREGLNDGSLKLNNAQPLIEKINLGKK